MDNRNKLLKSILASDELFEKGRKCISTLSVSLDTSSFSRAGPNNGRKFHVNRPLSKGAVRPTHRPRSTSSSNPRLGASSTSTPSVNPKIAFPRGLSANRKRINKKSRNTNNMSQIHNNYDVTERPFSTNRRASVSEIYCSCPTSRPDHGNVNWSSIDNQTVDAYSNADMKQQFASDPCPRVMMVPSHANFTGVPVPCRILNDSSTLEDLEDIPSYDTEGYRQQQHQPLPQSTPHYVCPRPLGISSQSIEPISVKNLNQNELSHFPSARSQRTSREIPNSNRSPSNARSVNAAQEKRKANHESCHKVTSSEPPSPSKCAENSTNCQKADIVDITHLNDEIVKSLQALMKEIRKRTQCIKESDLDRLVTNGELLVEHLYSLPIQSNKNPDSKKTKRHHTSPTKVINQRDHKGQPKGVSVKESSANNCEKLESTEVTKLKAELEKASTKVKSLQRSLTASKEEINALKCQYQGIILQMCSKDTEMTQMKHSHQQQLTDVRATNISLSTQINELMHENSQLKNSQQHLTEEVQRTTAVIEQVDEYFRKLLDGLSVSPTNSITTKVPHRPRIMTPTYEKETDNDSDLCTLSQGNKLNKDDDSLTATQLIQRVAQLLENVMKDGGHTKTNGSGSAQKFLNDDRDSTHSESSNLTVKNLQNHDSSYMTSDRLQTILSRFTSSAEMKVHVIPTATKKATRNIEESEQDSSCLKGVRQKRIFTSSSSSPAPDSLVSWLMDESSGQSKHKSIMTTSEVPLHLERLKGDSLLRSKVQFNTTDSYRKPIAAKQVMNGFLSSEEIPEPQENNDIGTTLSEYSVGPISTTTVSTMRSIDEQEFANGLANLDSQISRLQKVLHSA